MNWVGDNGQLFGWAETTWLWLDQAGILTGDVALAVGLLGGVWAWLSRDRIRQWLRANRFPVSGEQADDTEKWDALVFIVSQKEIPLWVIDSKCPYAVGLLATAQSMEIAEKLADHARDKGITSVGPKKLQDSDDPAEARAETIRLIERLRGMGCQHIGVDVTGGKTPMSIGAFLAAQESGCDTLYVASRFDPRLKKPDMSSARIRCITRV